MAPFVPLAACGGDGIAPPDAAPAPRLFVTVDRGYLPALHDLLDRARARVDIVHFSLNRDASGDAVEARLIATAKRGVRVRVLLENSVSSNPARVANLTAGGVEARLDTADRYTHAKLVVADDERALVGSTNWSLMSIEKNHESNLRVEDPALAALLGAHARAIFDAPEAPSSPSPVTTAQGTAWGDGGYVAHARPLIDGARRRILLCVYGMAADARYPDSDVFALIHALGAARRRGVEVRVILEQADYDPNITAVNANAAGVLRGEDVDVRFDRADVITHAKFLVADDQAVVGTNNWGYGGFSLYHEAGLRTALGQVVTDLTSYFESIWSEGTPAP